MDCESKIVNQEIIHVARACEAEGNEWLSKIQKIQLRLNSFYNVTRRNNPLRTVFGFHVNLRLDTLPYPINNYQFAIEGHNAASQGLINAKASQVQQANLHQTPEPQHNIEDQVLLATQNFHIENISL